MKPTLKDYKKYIDEEMTNEDFLKDRTETWTLKDFENYFTKTWKQYNRSIKNES